MNSDNRFNADGLVLSDRYADTMESAVLPDLAQRAVKSTVRGAGGRPLACVRFTTDLPRGTVLVLHGFTESAYKYAEIIHSLLRNRFCVLAYDQRGHGNSWRKEGLPDNSLTHVDSFEEYVTDLERVCAELLAGMPKPWYAFAHSMGGAVLCLFMERHADVFTRAALCSPMIAPNTGGIPPALGRLMCGGARLLGLGAHRPFVTKPYAGPEDFATSAATGKERFDWYDKVKQTHPEYQNNSPSYSWTLEAINVTKKLLAPGAPEKIACPVRLYGAERDGSVLPEAQERFIARVKYGTRAVVAGAKHEIYRSPDDVVFPWWHEVLTFLKG
ncbi:MAG: alpha/beta hydrolase [Clostridia bacterium]|nr:alpha/beta hydrolase [Clostridia bacterium]